MDSKTFDSLRRMAINDQTREVARVGCDLTWEQADELGAVAVAWMHTRLGLRVQTDEYGLFARPEKEVL